MLSAVAARKAALAAQSQHQANVPPAIASGSQTASPVVPKTGTSKRKQAAQKSRSETKKPRKVKAAQPAAKEKDDFVDQSDMIVVDDSDEDDSDSALSMMEEDDNEPTRIPPVRRAWSPSQPMEDSSDEESLDGGAEPLDISSLFPNTSNSQLLAEDGSGVLSIFEPVIDENVFCLTESELSLLGLSESTTLVNLNPEDSLCLLGTCRLTILQGSLSLCGTTLSSSRTTHAIFAPRSSPLPILRAEGRSPSPSVLNASNVSPRLHHLLQAGTVLAIQENRSGVEGLGRICRTFEGVFEPSRWQKSSTTAPFGIPGIFMITKTSKEAHAFIMPPSWSDALNAVSVPDSINALAEVHIIKGPKNSGKSTFARTLMNCLLGSYRRVAYLECDIGQSEFTPGGVVSLNIISTPIFGPPFTHPTLPNYAHFIGSTTPRSNPSHYLDAIRALIETYRLDIQTPAIEMMDDDDDSRIQDVIPLVVNTMGWSKGLGADLTQNIESAIDATHLYNVQAPVREEYAVSAPVIPVGGTYGAYHSHATMDASTAVVRTLEPITSFSAAAGYTAADHRALAVLSYFHAAFPPAAVPAELGQVTARAWDTARPLCAVPPYELDCAAALDRVVLTGGGGEDVVEAEIARVLNGALVGLVACEPGTLEPLEPAAREATAGITYVRGGAPPPPATSTCVGLALVRGVSPPTTPAEAGGQTTTATTLLHVLTPLPPALLAGVRVLVKGELELPVWGMLDFRGGGDTGDVAGVEREKVAFLQWGRAPEGVMGAEKRRVRRNLMRRGQM